jgi:hypothetical protein
MAVAEFRLSRPRLEVHDEEEDQFGLGNNDDADTTNDKAVRRDAKGVVDL